AQILAAIETSSRTEKTNTRPSVIPPKNTPEDPPTVETPREWPASVAQQMTVKSHWFFYLLWLLVIVAILAFELRRRWRAQHMVRSVGVHNPVDNANTTLAGFGAPPFGRSRLENTPNPRIFTRRTA